MAKKALTDAESTALYERDLARGRKLAASQRARYLVRTRRLIGDLYAYEKHSLSNSRRVTAESAALLSTASTLRALLEREVVAVTKLNVGEAP